MSARRQGSLANIVGRISYQPVDGSAPVPITWSEYLTGLTIEMTSWGAWNMHLSLWDTQGDFLEQFIIAAGANPIFSVQWDWDDGQALASAPIFQGGVIVHAPIITTTGYGIEADILPTSTISSNLTKQDWGFPNGFSVQGAFETIAAGQVDGSGLVKPWPLTDEGGFSTVQPSTSALPREVHISGETDLEFINSHIAPYAQDSQGRGGYRCFVGKNGAYHFHNRYFRPSPLSAYYRFARAAESDVISFEPVDAGPLAAMIGAGVPTLFNTTDAINQARIHQLTAAGVGVPGVTQTIWTGGGFRSKVMNNPDAVGSVNNLSERNVAAFKARLAQRFEELSLLSYTAKLVVLGTHNVKPFGTILVEFLKSDGSVHYLSGVFTVTHILHTLNSQVGWQTEMQLVRNGIGDASPSNTATDVDGNALAQQAATASQAPLVGVQQQISVGSETFDPSDTAVDPVSPPTILIDSKSSE